MDRAPLKARTSPANFIPFVFPGVSGVRCAFGTSGQGNMALSSAQDDWERSATIEARKSLLAHYGLQGWSELDQVHGKEFIAEPEPTPADAASTLQADGHATHKKRFGLAIKTADCQPVLLADLRGSAVAALHVGWRGNVCNFNASGVGEFCRHYGFSPHEVVAVRGPSLGPAEAEFIHFEQEWGDEFLPWFYPARKTMDLWALTRDQLLKAGVPGTQIFSLDLCTKSLPETFFSFRRKDAGRQMSLIWRE